MLSLDRISPIRDITSLTLTLTPVFGRVRKTRVKIEVSVPVS